MTRNKLKVVTAAKRLESGEVIRDTTDQCKGNVSSANTKPEALNLIETYKQKEAQK